jgi:hypothetical protein
MSSKLRHVVALLATALVASWLVPFASAADTQFSGQATVVKGTVLGIPVGPIVDTGPLPGGGGARSNALLCYPARADCDLPPSALNPLLQPDPFNGAVGAELLAATTVGQGSKSHSQSSLASLNVDLSQLLGVAGLPTVQAKFLQAEATAVCNAGVATASGATQITNLKIGDTPAGQLVVTDPLTGVKRIDLPGGVTIYLDQVTTGPNGTGGQEANATALEIVAPALSTDLIVGYAHADITCGSAAGACDGEKVTGGGWFPWNGSEDHFAIGAGYQKDGSPWGHLMFMDKSLGLKVKGSPLTTTFVHPTTFRDGEAIVEGPASANQTFSGKSVGWYVAHVGDNGEPGRTDQFSIALFDVKGGTKLYPAGADVASSVPNGGLGGGNIQYHRCK